MAKIIDYSMTPPTPFKVLTCESHECGVDFSFPVTYLEAARKFGWETLQIRCPKCRAKQERFYDDT